MIYVYDDFVPQIILEEAITQIKKHKFYDDKTHPSMVENKNHHVDDIYNAKWGGIRTLEISHIEPIFDKVLTHLFVHTNHDYFTQQFQYLNYAHLRLEKDDAEDYIHQDVGVNFAYILYLSESNPKSGTKFYDSCDADKKQEKQFVQFKKNRLVLFDATIPHMAWGSYGTNIDNGRLTINGFCKYYER